MAEERWRSVRHACDLEQKIAKMMKRIPVLWFVISAPLLTLSTMQAQGANQDHVQQSASSSLKPSTEETSWLFLLESRTQWLLVIHQNRETSSTSSFSNLDPQTLSHSISAGIAASEQARGSDSRLPNKSPVSNHTVIVLEGNTLDVPLEPDLPWPQKPVKPTPSAPNS